MTVLKSKCKSSALKTFINFGPIIPLPTDFPGNINYLFDNNEEINHILNNTKIMFLSTAICCTMKITCYALSHVVSQQASEPRFISTRTLTEGKRRLRKVKIPRLN